MCLKLNLAGFVAGNVLKTKNQKRDSVRFIKDTKTLFFKSRGGLYNNLWAALGKLAC